MLTPSELEDRLDGGAEEVARAASAGPWIVAFPDGRFGEHADGALPYVGHGLLGLDTGPVVAFTDAPAVTVGSLPGGGHVSLATGELLGEVRIDADGAAALVARAGGGLKTQYQIEIVELRSDFDAPVVRAHLRGVRVVIPATREVLLEGVPAQR